MNVCRVATERRVATAFACLAVAALLLVAGGCGVEADSNAAVPTVPSDWESVSSLGGEARLHLDFSGSSLTDADLATLPFLDVATEVDLSNTKVTNEGLTHLVKAERLELLNLESTAVSDEGIETLKKLPRLCEVRLHSSAVSGAAQIHMLKFLKPRAEARNSRRGGGRGNATAARAR